MLASSAQVILKSDFLFRIVQDLKYLVAKTIGRLDVLLDHIVLRPLFECDLILLVVDVCLLFVVCC